MERVLQEVKVESLWFDEEYIYLKIADGRIIGNPIKWFPRLATASKEQRNNYEFICRNTGIHWPDIDEDLSVKNMISSL